LLATNHLLSQLSDVGLPENTFYSNVSGVPISELARKAKKFPLESCAMAIDSNAIGAYIKAH